MSLNRQIVVRVSDDLYEHLRADAETNGRTVAQSVRFHLERRLTELAVQDADRIRKLRGDPFEPIPWSTCTRCRRPLMSGETPPYCADCEMGQ